MMTLAEFAFLVALSVFWFVMGWHIAPIWFKWRVRRIQRHLEKQRVHRNHKYYGGNVIKMTAYRGEHVSLKKPPDDGGPPCAA